MSRGSSVKFCVISALPWSTPAFPNLSKFCLTFEWDKVRAKQRKSSLNYFKTLGKPWFWQSAATTENVGTERRSQQVSSIKCACVKHKLGCKLFCRTIMPIKSKWEWIFLFPLRHKWELYNLLLMGPIEKKHTVWSTLEYPCFFKISIAWCSN